MGISSHSGLPGTDRPKSMSPWAASLAPGVLLMKRFLMGLATICISLGTSIEAAAGTGSWPQFLGPDRNNISKETGLLKKWPEGGPRLLWTAQGCGRGYSAVAVTGKMIYTTGCSTHIVCSTKSSSHMPEPGVGRAPCGAPTTGIRAGTNWARARRSSTLPAT